MEIREKLMADMKEAMKAKDSVKLDAIRFLQSAIKYKEVEVRPNAITHDDVIGVIKKLVKQRKESIEQFKQASRQDLVDKETLELKVLENYLPSQLSAEKVTEIVNQVITKLGAKTIKEMGSVMKEVMVQTAGAADNKMVSEIIKQKLS